MAMRRSKPDENDAVPSEVARQIDENLKRLYGPSAGDELPQDLQRLIASLRAGEVSPDAGAESK
ncbi:MAG: hypothetical protein JJU24_16375 [Natronohydrobacter sp.]|nr:hypothetical protein [Natronohydrobacter sp.]